MGLIFNGNGDVIKAVDGSLTVEGLDLGGSSNVNAGIGTFSSLSVTGTLTYEDVKNVDSVGIVTARAGIHAKDDSTFYGATSGRNVVWDKSENSLEFGDYTYAKFGLDEDLTVWSNNTASAINNKTGELRILSGTNVRILKRSDAGLGFAAQVANFNIDGACDFYHSGTKRIETTSTGAVVTGILTATSFKGDGSALTGLNSDKIIEGNSYAEVLDTGTNGIFRFLPEGIEKFRITTDGKVGIGTYTPAQKLDIRDGDLVLSSSNAGNAHRTSFIEFTGSYARINSVMGQGSTSNSNYAAGWNFTTRNYTGSAFETLTPFTIQANGKIGINSTSPDYKLDVNGTGRFADDLTINTTKKIQTNSSTGQLTIQPGPSYPGGSIKFAGGQSGATDRGTLIFYAGETTSLQERLRITSAGHLQLQGGTVYGDDSATATFKLQNTSGNSNHARIEIGAIQSSDNGGIHFYTAGSSTATRYMTLKGGGNLGIGIDNPTSRLYVNGVSTSDIITARAADTNGASVINILAEGTTGISRIKFSDTAAPTGDGWISYYHSDRAIAFATAGTGNERLRITSGGSVTVKSGGQLRIEDSGNSTANSTHTTGALRCNLIRSDTSNNNAYTGTYFMNVNAAGGGIKSVGIVETGLKVGDFTSNLAAAEKIKLTHTGHVEIKTDGGRLKIGAGNDLQMYHDNGGSVNHITCVNNQQLKVSCNALTVYEYTGNTIAFNVDADRKIRTNGAAAHGHTGMIYIQGLSDPAAMQTKSNLTVRGEGGNGLCFGTYEGTANYGSWIQAGYVENFSTAVYPLVLNPNGNCVCIGNYDNNSTTDAGLLRVQSRHGSNFYNDCTLSLEHYNQSNAREQKWHFISASNQGTEAKSNSKFRQMAVPYQTDTNYQTWTDQIVYAHTVGHNQYCWYKFNTRASSSPDRGGSARIAITWSTRHAAGTGYGEYSFAWYDHHSTSRVECFLRKQHFMSYTGGSYYGWTSNPEVVVYSCTGGGSAAGFYLRLRGHGSHNGSTYDMGTMHNFHIIHNDNNSGGNNSFFEFVSNASGGPSDASSALSFN